MRDKEDNSHFKLIWGMQDNGLPSTSLYDLNDIDVIYDGEYHLEFEEIYSFDSDVDRINYYKNLVNKFKEWLIEQGYKISDDIYSACNCFTNYYPTTCIENIMPLKDKDIVQLYYKAELFILCLEGIYSNINTGLEK